MSDVVTLTLRQALDTPLEVDSIVPDRFAGLGEREIAALPAWRGRRTVQLGDVFDVRGERSDRVRVAGAVRALHGLGARTAGGELVIEGDAGDRVGTMMTGGTIEVRGSAGDDAGQAMAGGTLRIDGDAGDRLGAATPGASRGMTGGEIVVRGSSGREAGARVRRGLIVVAGDAGASGARAMIAGTLVVFGRAGRGSGSESKRGTVLAVGGIDIPATYAYACTYRPGFVRMLMTYLRRTHGLDVGEQVAGGRFRRYCGDAGDPGKGEILQWVAE